MQSTDSNGFTLATDDATPACFSLIAIAREMDNADSPEIEIAATDAFRLDSDGLHLK